MKPMFIVIEALDGVGKTTLVNDLAKSLSSVAMNTPGDKLRSVSDVVLDVLGDDQIARCLFYASSVISCGNKAREIVNRGETVVMDRYWLSTIAYARARGVSEQFREVESRVAYPDITVVLTLDEAERVRRMAGRSTITDADRETLDENFRDTVLKEIFNPHRHAALRPTVKVNVSNCDRQQAVERVLSAICLEIDSNEGTPRSATNPVAVSKDNLEGVI